MKEYEGNRQHALLILVFGAILLVVSICSLILVIINKRILESIFIAIFGIGSIVFFIIGLSHVIYSRKIVLKVYDDKIEFLNAGKLFNTKWVTIDFSSIKEFKVTRNGYIVYKKKPKYVNLKSGDIEFLFDGGYCWVELKDCFAAGREIISKLDDDQISKGNELKN